MYKNVVLFQRNNLWVEKNIAGEPAFRRNALCLFMALRLAQNVPTERKEPTQDYRATYKMFLRNKNHTKQLIKHIFCSMGTENIT
jgi:hypothetical protein